MQKIKFILKYLKYKLSAKHRKGFGIHSPFLYHFVREILYGKQYSYAYDEIAELRYDLLENNEEIPVKDFGAGSIVMKSNVRKIKDIAKHSGISEKFGEMLFRIIEHYKPHTIIELGTSLGLGTLFLTMPDSKAKIYTIEGCLETAKKALQNFEELNVKNINQIVGNIDDELPKVLKNIDKLLFGALAGNHQKEATLNYFNWCKQKAKKDTIFYFDDIRWSKGMEEVWEEIKADKEVRLTVDLFFSGIVFFRKELSKENFVIKF